MCAAVVKEISLTKVYQQIIIRIMDIQTKKEFQKLNTKIDFGFTKLDKKIDSRVDELARITKRGFDYVDKRFEGIDKRFVALDKIFREELQNLRAEMPTHEQMDKILAGQDQILGKLENLEQDKIIRDFQMEKQRKLNEVVIAVLYKNKIIDDMQLEQIKALEII